MTVTEPKIVTEVRRVVADEEFQPAVRNTLAALSTQIENVRLQLESEFGALEAQVKAVQKDVTTLKTDMTEVKEMLQKLLDREG